MAALAAPLHVGVNHRFGHRVSLALQIVRDRLAYAGLIFGVLGLAKGHCPRRLVVTEHRFLKVTPVPLLALECAIPLKLPHN